MVKNKILSVIILICVCFSLCGAGWFDNTRVVIDTENNHVYRYCSADTVITAFANNHKEAKKEYHDAFVFLSGKISNIGKDGKKIILTGSMSTDLSIECSYEKELRETALVYSVGENIALFGKMTIDPIDKDIRLKAVKIVESPIYVTSNDMYYLLDGASFDKTSAKKITLNNGEIEYYIPSSWSKEDVQINIVDEKLGEMEGYQYALNKLEVGETVPESLFVCYFNNQNQLSDYLNDSDETELIEKAIVENILGNVGSFPSKTVDTYFGSEYVYYTGAYKTAFDTGTGYHTEFVFQADGEEGIVVILYVYKETKHLSDIMFVSRFLEISSN